MDFGTLSSIFVITLCFCPLTSQQMPQSNTDLYFLSEFFKKMGLNFSTNFDFSAEMCSLQGVVCDASTKHVVNFVSSGMGLSGVIPDNTIGKLAKLESLDLSNNKITGWPADLWNLGSLKKVNFSHNQISGSLSSNIVNFGGLKSLDLSYNKFSGKIPASLTSLGSLHVLKLNENAFEGSIPSGLLSCKFLVLIDLSSNRLSGTLPHDFASAFPKLKTLNLAGNEIDGRASDFTELKALTYLNISGNLFKGSVMDAFLGSLEVMDLSGNQFSGHISQVTSNSSFKWSSSLVYLDLSDNQLSGEIFHVLKNAQSLKGLNLAHNRFSRQTFPQIDNLSSLEYLNLSETSITGRIPTEISQLNNLVVLDVSNNHLSDRIPRLSSKKLKIVDMSCNNLSGAIPASIMAELRMMERFNFSYNNNLTFCSSELVNQTVEFQSAFIGSLSNCPIAANPNLFKSKHRNHKEIILALALTFSMLCLLVGLLCLAFSCRRRTTTWAVKQPSYNEEQNISGPFSFQTDSTTWVADVKQATSVPVIIFEKPLLNITFADLLSATSHFDRGTLLAEGRFGPVYRGFLPGGIHVAVKVLVHRSTMTDQEAAKELGYLGRIKHPNLVPLTGYCMAGEQRIAIYDYMENGNLQNLLHDLPLGVQMTEDWSTDTWEEDENNGIQNVGSEGLLTTWRFRHKVALGTARSLAFLHHGCSPPIIHRDVKASSVYLDSNLEPRLSDFGLAKIFGNDMEEEISRGSPGYVPPEFYYQDSVSPKAPTPKSDVFGFGVVLFELVTGKKPVGDDYPEDKEGTLVSWVRGLVRNGVGSRAIDAKIHGTASDVQMEEALKIGYLCTADLPMKRPTMQQIVGLLKDIEPVVNR